MSGTSWRCGAPLPDTVARALGMGAIAGFRSLAAPAALSRAASEGRIGSLEDTPFAALGSSGVATVLLAFEVGEMLVDSEGRRIAVGVALGATAAVVSAYAGERLRLQAVERLGIPDPVVALLE